MNDVVDRANRLECAACAGQVAPGDSFCTHCGSPLTRPDGALWRQPRNHLSVPPMDWAAGLSDRGIDHEVNEDAVAVAADSAVGGWAVLVACDGVSSSRNADLASAAATAASLEVLTGMRPSGEAGERIEQVRSSLVAAAAEADRAVRALAGDADQPPATTWVAAVLDPPHVVVGWVGDSRAYWLPDLGTPLQLSVDDSLAELRVAAGTSRAEAESQPGSHTILRWLGRDAPEPVPSCTTTELDAPGWLLLCTDGLWNYASTPDQMSGVLAGLAQASSVHHDDGSAEGPAATALAEALVQWACGQGGQDNVTVAVARYEPTAALSGG